MKPSSSLRWLCLLAGMLPTSDCQLSSIGVITSGASRTSSSSISSSTISSTSSPVVSTSSSMVTTSTPSTTTGTPGPGDPLVVTTIFTPPPDCDQGYSVLTTGTDYMFENIMNPAPGLYISSCYPSQFFTSGIATTSVPPFKQLLCPSGWDTGYFNSTYIYCCPRRYSVAHIDSANVQRPAESAVCYTRLPPQINFAYTVYNSLGSSNIITTSVGPSGAMVLATLFDGTLASVTAAAGVPQASTPTSMPTPMPTSTTLSSSTTSTASHIDHILIRIIQSIKYVYIGIKQFIDH